MLRTVKKSAKERQSVPGVPQGKESLKTRIKDAVCTKFKNVLFCILCQCVIKQLLNSVFRDIQNYPGLGKCYQLKPITVTSPLDNSGYHEHLIQ